MFNLFGVVLATDSEKASKVGICGLIFARVMIYWRMAALIYRSNVSNVILMRMTRR
jgi:hypothetical protein